MDTNRQKVTTWIYCCVPLLFLSYFWLINSSGCSQVVHTSFLFVFLVQIEWINLRHSLNLLFNCAPYWFLFMKLGRKWVPQFFLREVGSSIPLWLKSKLEISLSPWFLALINVWWHDSDVLFQPLTLINTVSACVNVNVSSKLT